MAEIRAESEKFKEAANPEGNSSRHFKLCNCICLLLVALWPWARRAELSSSRKKYVNWNEMKRRIEKQKSKGERREKKGRQNLHLYIFFGRFVPFSFTVSKTRIYHRRLARCRVYQSDWTGVGEATTSVCLDTNAPANRESKRAEKRRQTTWWLPNINFIRPPADAHFGRKFSAKPAFRICHDASFAYFYTHVSFRRRRREHFCLASLNRMDVIKCCSSAFCFQANAPNGRQNNRKQLSGFS